MKRFLIPALAVGVVLATTSQSQAASLTPPTPLVLDTFDTGNFRLDKSAGTTTGTFSTTQTGSGILGTERRVQFTISNHPDNRSAIVEVRDGEFTLDTGPNVLTSVLMTWDGIGNGSLNKDLTTGGLDAFRVGITDIDQDANLKFTVTDTLGRSSFLTKNNLGFGDSFFNFADFVAVGTNPSADFTSVKSVKLQVTSPTAIDMQLQFLEAAKVPPATVPEPFTMLGSVAALGFGAAFRRKYQKKA
ncbi:PEP-CTERM sorting domain-containing protein [Merismopedia glauca]|uniref:PEP-CTERM sorting domain-containing protein n=1 Tax=Merismopedia glauca CCAP 1448/3 TaxID=1296344 RepID=A0A2T1CAS4_9CYAN|nr:PEP-CTERM sorting domain-containing protein [Merismopedia glauca]PSB05247.1 hypothetical protein C7B64_00120 [Merismopedia glauca CCAP 1448/3]